jgi:hypothetical protein
MYVQGLGRPPNAEARRQLLTLLSSLDFKPLGAMRAGERGPLLLQDSHLVDTLASFVRERIPERVVHARGIGAHGVSDSISCPFPETC